MAKEESTSSPSGAAEPSSSPSAPSEPSREMGFATRAIHAGFDPDPLTGAVMPPIYLSTTYEQTGIGENRGFSYARIANPTRKVLQDCLTNLEGADYGFAFSSGIAAEDAVLRLLRPGDHVLFSHILYGGTYRLITQLHSETGITSDYVDVSDLAAVEAAWRPETKMIWLESPTNPLVTIADIAAASEIAHAHGALAVVDNTFASPYLQNPLALGADIVTHSATKYIAGHSDVVSGFAATSDPDLAERIRIVQTVAGGIPSPLDCYLVLRGVMTLPLRMDRHCANALEIAHFLDSHPAVAKVNYPGLPSHPGHELAARQMSGQFGAMMSIVMAGGAEAAKQLGTSLKLFAFAESLGGVESLVSYPPTMSHKVLDDTNLAMDEGLIRLSIGIEAVEDLIYDLAQVLDKLG